MMNIIHDGSLSLATGKNRKETHWKNTTAQWSEVLERLSVTHRTHETVAEYNKATKARQAEIKDIGGFVAGYVNNGRRKAGNIANRSTLTLDLDFAQPGFWELFTLIYGCAGCMYSTHKHTPESPRLRLIIPLNREVFSDEYVAIARRVAGMLGINDFDDTTFDPSRLMYWPSTSVDGEYLFEYQDGEWLDADAILGSYRNWRSASEWPTSDRVDDAILRDIRKQGDPLEKTGIIGAWCREYDIHAAIETFLSDLYEQVANDENRYSYVHGSTAGGLVVYEDKFAFSHHGTDPCSGKLVNAFDLVRIHLYGLKDEDMKEGTPPSKYPSFLAMEDFAAADKNTRKRIGIERLESAKDAFTNLSENEVGESTEENTETPANLDWLGEMEVDRKGVALNTVCNCRLIFENHPAFKDKFAYNEFRNTNDLLAELPWRKLDQYMNMWGNSDNDQMIEWFERNFAISSDSKIRTARNNTFNTHRYHPVKDYLNSLVWDGVNRVETVFIDYLGAKDTDYTRTVTRKSLVAAVTRVMQPGCKYDYVLVLVGKQGIGKSVTLQKLGNSDKGWFSDNFDLRGTKEDVEQVLGVWIKEIQELAGFYGKNADRIKSFISSRQDETRLAFKEEKGYFPRQCVFFGTTNNNSFLNDPTGNRRFWPVKCHVQEPTKSFRTMENDVGQIWAEAVVLHSKGETLYLTPEMEAKARNEQEECREEDPLEGIIEDYLNTPIPKEWKELDLGCRRTFLRGGDTLTGEPGTVLRTKVAPLEIWQEVLNGDERVDRLTTRRINDILRANPNWEDSGKIRSDGGYYGRGFKRKI